MKPLRVGIIGLGVGEQHALSYQNHPACRVVSLCDYSRKTLAQIKNKFPGTQLTQDANSLLRDPNVDVVSIASYDDHHARQVQSALEAGKHVFVEKPLCRTREELRAIKQAWAKHHGQLKLATNVILRAAPLFQWLKDQIETGALGEIYAIDGDYLYGRLEKLTKGWRRNVPHYSVLQGGGIHLIDLMLWLTGQRPTAVTVEGNRICTRGTAFKYLDYQAATFHFPSTLVGRITANFGCVHKHHHVLRVFGTKATFLYDDQGPRLYTRRDPKARPYRVPRACLPCTKGDLISPFINAILQGHRRQRDTQAHFDVISLLDTCQRALTTRRTEKVHYL
jgi:predicted dehydrogenase